MVLIVILATALVSLVASYAYLAAGAAWPDTPPGGWRRGAPRRRGAGRGRAGRSARATRSLSADGVRRRRAALAAALGLHAVCVAARAHAAYRETGVTPETSAYGSIVLALFLFQWLVAGLALAMLGTAALWAWLAPADVRGHATLVNAALVAYFALGAALVVLATIYLGPLLA